VRWLRWLTSFLIFDLHLFLCLIFVLLLCFFCACCCAEDNELLRCKCMWLLLCRFLALPALNCGSEGSSHCPADLGFCFLFLFHRRRSRSADKLENVVFQIPSGDKGRVMRSSPRFYVVVSPIPCLLFLTSFATAFVCGDSFIIFVFCCCLRVFEFLFSYSRFFCFLKLRLRDDTHTFCSLVFLFLLFSFEVRRCGHILLSLSAK
jgi:hypothetical protein